jgi:hypothetical protein
MTVSVEQIIYLDLDDEITTIREKLEQAQASRVLLVVPERSSVLQSLVNLKLLRRYADGLVMQVILVTSDHTTRELARSLGFAVVSSVERGQAASRARPEARPATTPLAPPRLVPEQETVFTPLAGWPRYGEPTQRVAARPLSPARKIAIYVLLFLALLAVATAALFLVPSATIALNPAGEPLSQSITVRASPDITAVDADKREIPAREVEAMLEDSAQAETTGKKLVPDTRAKGRVVFANRSLSSLAVPQGTIVSTGSGVSIRFRTLAEVVLPAAAWGTAEAEIEAVEPGSSGNVAASTINQVEGPLRFQIGVLNAAPTTGGAEKQVRFVTSKDRSDLAAKLLEQLKNTGYEGLQKAMQPGDFLPRQSLDITVQEQAFDHLVDEEASTLTMRMKATATGLVVPASQLNVLAEGVLASQVKPGYQLVPGSVKTATPTNVTFDGSTLVFQMDASGAMATQIDPAQVRRLVRGQPLAEAEAILAQSLKLAGQPQVTLEPAWLGRVPFLDFRIAVQVGGDAP